MKKRIKATWKEHDVTNPRLPKKKMLLSPIYWDQKSKKAALQWMADRFEADPLIQLSKVKFDVVYEDFGYAGSPVKARKTT